MRHRFPNGPRHGLSISIRRLRTTLLLEVCGNEVGFVLEEQSDHLFSGAYDGPSHQGPPAAVC